MFHCVIVGMHCCDVWRGIATVSGVTVDTVCFVCCTNLCRLTHGAGCLHAGRFVGHRRRLHGPVLVLLNAARFSRLLRGVLCGTWQSEHRQAVAGLSGRGAVHHLSPRVDPCVAYSSILPSGAQSVRGAQCVSRQSLCGFCVGLLCVPIPSASVVVIFRPGQVHLRLAQIGPACHTQTSCCDVGSASSSEVQDSPDPSSSEVLSL
jgi:hypothetical protein